MRIIVLSFSTVFVLLASQAKACEFKNDGVCDEPWVCATGTDTRDCRSNPVNTAPISVGEETTVCATANNGVCEEPLICKTGTDVRDCSIKPALNSCASSFDGACDEPRFCARNTDSFDCEGKTNGVCGASETKALARAITLQKYNPRLLATELNSKRIVLGFECADKINLALERSYFGRLSNAQEFSTQVSAIGLDREIPLELITHYSQIESFMTELETTSNVGFLLRTRGTDSAWWVAQSKLQQIREQTGSRKAQSPAGFSDFIADILKAWEPEVRP